jgi:energy-coupling factor transporter ATP-binding protein EcfA2
VNVLGEYFRLGWRVIPLKGKRPFIEGWQNLKLTPEEFKANYREGDNVGVITGWLKQGELALIALDVDEPRLLGFDFDFWIASGAMAHTTSTGKRIVFYTDSAEVAGFSRKVAVAPEDLTEEERQLVQKAKGKESITLLEVLAEGRQFMAPPSVHPETGQRLEWVVGPVGARNCLVVHSLGELKQLLAQSIHRSRWVVEELFETSRLEAKGDMEVLQGWLERILERLKPNYAGETPRYYTFHCPFHEPDRNPSFVINKLKLYAFDYHDGTAYSLKQLAKRLGVELSELEKKPSLWLGDYRFAVSGKDFMLYDKQGACVFTCKLSFLNSGRNKRQIKQITGASEAEVECAIASFLERVKAEEEKRVEEEKEGEKRVVRAAFVELPDGRLIEEAYDGENIYFLVYNPNDGKVEKLSEVETEDCVYRPIQSEEVEHGTVLLPSNVEEYGSDEQLVTDIVDFLNRWHEPPDVLSRVLDAYYAFLTYISDLLPQVPYRRYLAPWGRGKTTWLDALGSICYRPVFLAGSDTEKSLVRRMNTWRGTCVVDEADFSDSSLYSFIIKILNIGYDRRRGWYYRCDDDNPRKVVGYNVFGCKCLATRTRYKDVALESRCLTTVGRENMNPLPLFRMEKFMREAQTLRNKLILWRFRNYHRVKGLVAELEKPDIAEKIYNGGGQISNRVKQVILPLWLVAGDKTRAQLVNLALTFDSQLKAADSDYVLEVEAREAASAMIENGSGEVNVVNVLNVLMQPPKQEQYYAVQLSELSRQILKSRGYGEKEITVKEVTSLSKQLARVFETRLGFTVRLAKARKRVVLIPSEWLKRKENPDLLDLLQSEAPSYKDVQKVHHVHPEAQATLTQDNVERVFQALAEAARVRGSATTEEVALEAELPLDTVKAVLEALQRDGRVYSPYPDWWKLA